MDCTQPGLIAPEDLLAFLDGEASPVVGEHVRNCPGCAARARAYARTEGRLRGALRRIDCPSPLLLGEYQEQLLPPGDQMRIAAHVVDCPRCAEELGELRGFLRDEPAVQPGPLDRVRRIFAALVAAPPRGAYASLRGGGTGGTRTYLADRVSISISDGRAERRGRCSLDGLIWREDGEATDFAGAATLYPAAPAAEPAALETVAIDDLGNFAFDAIEPGSYDLELALGERRIVIAGLAIVW